MAPEINTPQVIAATLVPRPDRPSVTVRMVLDARTGAYTPRSVLVEHPMINVTPTLMARMRLGAVRRALVREALEKAGVPMMEADVTMIPQNWVELTDEESIKKMQRILDLLDEDDDVQATYHNWDE